MADSHDKYLIEMNSSFNKYHHDVHSYGKLLSC